jgi:DNA mismatch repair protein MutS
LTVSRCKNCAKNGRVQRTARTAGARGDRRAAGAGPRRRRYRPGYSEELDEWRALADGATDYLDKLEIRERERLGLDTLKVGYNAVHGYYIQISRGQSHLAPIHYVRRQTLKNAERYIIPELKEYEDKVLTSKGKALALEKQLYDELFDLLLPHLADLQTSASALAELDVLVNLASAETLNYCCPTFSDKPGIRISEGRHPVVEQVLKEPFIANPLRWRRSGGC